ncbi:disulfide-isomerase a6 [Brachionus plicatilis]|uniref:Disulfide-isomerase a6 n=1 Tax=Brachionus plicatilis TaxID=10195 RepID=A0A3M7Q076_BRAPC|nr:disulfide-isomerase a6 [Brachionus plicatilis]
MVTGLLELKKQELVIICDGTYTHIEKSFNNEMQYRTYSVQKSTSLIKPFIICCSDGYIIDCYGAFDANLNDASIFKYVLSKDQNLKNKILLPGKTKIILDRGFRDVVELLMQEFEYDVRIPTCYQIEKSEDEQEKNGCKSKQLSSEQANKTRIVTKFLFRAFICNYLSGQKTAGCCSYVASVIYFLSYLKFRLSGINLRGEYLNKIVIDLDNNQILNRPINIRGKRNRKESSSDSELTSSESEQSDFDNSVEQVTTLQNHYDEIADSELINFKMNIPTWGSLI